MDGAIYRRKVDSHARAAITNTTRTTPLPVASYANDSLVMVGSVIDRFQW